MGAVCYKARPSTISKDEVLRALNDKHLKTTITEPDNAKTNKSAGEEQSINMMTFGNLTQNLQIDTHDYQNISSQNPSAFQASNSRHFNLNAAQFSKNFAQIELNILSYYGYKEDIYESLTMMSRKSLFFLKKNQSKIEKMSAVKQANEKIRLIPVKSIEEHSSGVNQLLKVSPKELVTVSDDCYLKFWSSQSFKCEGSLTTETITCIAITGFKTKEILVAGCHSGNLLLINAHLRTKKEQITSAHYNLIRVIVSLETLKNKLFVTADVCGVVKVWTAAYKPQQLIEFDLEQAISYNSMIEIQDMLPKRSFYEETALIACALKSQKVNLILLIPNSGSYQIIKTLKTSHKPTCLIQLSTKHIAVAVGSLKEPSIIEVHDLNKNKVISMLKHHSDMIDSLHKISLPSDKTRTSNPYITWILSASRDRQIVLWKLIDGKIMKRSYQSLVASLKKTNINNQVPVAPNQKSNNRLNAEEYKKSKLKKKKKQSKLQRKRNSQSEERDDEEEEKEEEDEEEDEEEEDSDSEESKQPLINEVLTGSGKNTQNEGGFSQACSTKMLDYYFVLDSGHKDFIRSMVQVNDNTLVTASEDKSIKIFTIGF